MEIHARVGWASAAGRSRPREKRPGALARGSATHARLRVLHTNEPLGDGVASPHTPSQLAYIQKLKTRHGIDYDCHASYGFVER